MSDRERNVWTFLVALAVAWGIVAQLLNPYTWLFGWMGIGVLVLTLRVWAHDEYKADRDV